MSNSRHRHRRRRKYFIFLKVRSSFMQEARGLPTIVPRSPPLSKQKEPPSLIFILFGSSLRVRPPQKCLFSFARIHSAERRSSSVVQTLTNDWKDASFPPSLPNRHLSETERVYALPLSGRGEGGGGDGDFIDRENPSSRNQLPGQKRRN